MPFKFFPPTYGEGEEIMQVPAVRKALRAEADRLFTVAKQLAEADKLTVFANSLRVEEGTRPKGRPYAEVIADDPQGEAIEYGDTDTERRRVLGRAGNTQINLQG